MPDNLRVRYLVEKILESNLTPEHVCASDPGILPAVRKRLEQLRHVGCRLDQMFPPNGSMNRADATTSRVEVELPNRSRAMARIYADAFAAAPSLADDLGAGHRYNAARAAAQAGCGHGADATALGKDERTQWRAQARRWLQADLAARTSALETGSMAARGANRLALTRWQSEPDLAGLREPGELDRLAADERTECLALWAELAAVLARTRK